MMNLLELPKEILEKIFVYTSARDILRMNQTCKVLEEAIGGSVALMKKLTLYVNPEQVSELDTILQSTRKYFKVSLKFSETVPCAVFDILEKFGDSVKHLTIHHSEVKSNEFQRILGIFQKLELLKLRKLQYEPNLSVCINRGAGITIDVLEFDESSLMALQHFQSADVKEFCVICYQEESDNIAYVIDFLEAQQKLEALSLQGTIPYHLFLTDFSSKFNFSLKYLVVRFLVFLTRDELIENYKTFLRLHVKTLLHYDSDIINEDILRITLNEMESVKHLGIQAFGKRLPSNFRAQENFQVNHQIKSLEFDFSQEFPYEEILKFTPNVRKMTLKALQISFKLIVAIFHELKELHHLNILSCKFQNFLWLPSVKSVIFEETDPSQVSKFLMCNRQIEKLVINGKTDADLREIIRNLPNLQSLHVDPGAVIVPSLRHFYPHFNN